ncbi:MAG: hypothetical protein WBE70_15525, partial [Candidatus Acidiferrum sp.]
CGWTRPRKTAPLNVMAELPGKALTWIGIAQPEFERENLQVDKYFVTVVEEDESVSVILTGSRISKEVRGDPGPIPGYEVEISKKGKKVIRANYIR